MDLSLILSMQKMHMELDKKFNDETYKPYSDFALSMDSFLKQNQSEGLLNNVEDMYAKMLMFCTLYVKLSLVTLGKISHAKQDADNGTVTEESDGFIVDKDFVTNYILATVRETIIQLMNIHSIELDDIVVN